MSNTIAIATSGLKTEETYIDALANDIANINTPNYKADHIQFTDLLNQSGSSIQSESKYFSQGPLKATQQWQDVAIEGDGFYQVTHPDGSIKYTRQSGFILDDERYLSLSNGMRLSDDIQIPEDASQITISESGEVSVVRGNDNTLEVIGNITLARFANTEKLHAITDGLYEATPQSGEAITDTPGQNQMGELKQYFIESSNVDMVASLMQLTLAQRVYQLNAKALQFGNEMEKMIDDMVDA